MPIYEYACNSCGAEKEHLQKMSDAPITNCPVCGSSHYTKLISAAGFRLKGGGWYVTDFKDSNKSSSVSAKETTKENAKTDTALSAATTTGSTATSPATTTTAAD